MPHACMFITLTLAILMISSLFGPVSFLWISIHSTLMNLFICYMLYAMLYAKGELDELKSTETLWHW